VTLPLETARAIITRSRAYATSHGFEPLTAVVIDAGGHVVAAEREDGSSIKRFEIAFGKAHGAVALGMGSRAIQRRAQSSPHFISGVAAAIGGALVPAPGGVLIRDADGLLIGAIGISGDQADNDEAAAIAAIIGVGLIAQAE
jgi:uncharacterized protein GlcG (DUF336 family)